jgi:hypothetical protein
MTNWNPNSPGTLGMEWLPTAAGAIAVGVGGGNEGSSIAAVSYDQSTSQAIGTIQIANVGIPTRGGIYAVEAYDNETAVTDAVVFVDAVPNEDVSIGTWKTQAGGTSNLYLGMDEGFGGGPDGLFSRSAGASTTYYGRLNTGSLSLTGKRIVGVKLGAFCQIGPTGLFSIGLNIGGSDYPGINNLAGPRTPAWVYTPTWLYNPSTKKPWTIADVQAFDTTDEYYLRGQTNASVWAAVDVDVVTFTVYYVTETRLAVGALDDYSSGLTVGATTNPQWNNATVVTPTGGTWTKDGSGKHLVTVRRINGTGSMNIPYLDSGVAAPPARGWSPTLNATYGIVTAMGNAMTRVNPVVLRTTAPAESVDGLPYGRILVGNVFTGQEAQQEITTVGAASYGVITALVKPQNATASMDIRIRRRSDNVQFGGTLTVTPAQIAALPDYFTDGWKALRMQLPSPGALAATTQYYIQFSSSAVSSAAAWGVAVVATGNVGNTAGVGSTTDAGTANGAEQAFYDVLANVSTVPTAPASMTAALGAQSVDQTICCVAEIERADLSWSVTALGGSFLRYEIERSENAGSTWTDVANIALEATTTWKDYEAVRGVGATYRIRVVRTDGAFSAWTTAAATITKPTVNNALYLVSNFDPTYNLAYDYAAERNYDFNEEPEQVTQGVYMRDYQLGFNPIEYRGTTGNFTLKVGVDDKVPPGGGKGINAFAPLRDIARAALPYVCVLDALGNRLLSLLRVPSGEHQGYGEIYMATIAAVEVTAEPYVVTA